MLTSAQGAGDRHPLLTIGDLAERTGLSPATLRMWEQRHGFPRPQRLDSGHRRYLEADVAAVADVVRRRDAGVRLDVAIAEARSARRARTGGARRSTPTLRRKHPHLPVATAAQVARCWRCRGRSRTSSAPRPTGPTIFGAFQQERYYAAARPRWAELALVSRSAFAFAEFPDLDGPRPSAPPPGRGRCWCRCRPRSRWPRVGGGLRLGGPAGGADGLGAARAARGPRPRAGLRVDVHRRARRRPRRCPGVCRRRQCAPAPARRTGALRPGRPAPPGTPRTWPRSARCSAGCCRYVDRSVRHDHRDRSHRTYERAARPAPSGTSASPSSTRLQAVAILVLAGDFAITVTSSSPRVRPAAPPRSEASSTSDRGGDRGLPGAGRRRPPAHRDAAPGPLRAELAAGSTGSAGSSTPSAPRSWCC